MAIFREDFNNEISHGGTYGVHNHKADSHAVHKMYNTLVQGIEKNPSRPKIVLKHDTHMILFSKSLDPHYAYRLTYFDNFTPVGHGEYTDLKKVAQELANAELDNYIMENTIFKTNLLETLIRF